MQWILEKMRKGVRPDLEAWEMGLKAAVMEAGAGLLSRVLRQIGCGRREGPVLCRCGARMESRGTKPKELLTLLGPTPYARSAFECPVCHAIRYPGDEALDVIDTTRSPGVRRMMARAGSHGTFKEGAKDLEVYAQIEVSPKDVERVSETIGEDFEAWAAREREVLWALEETPGQQKTIPILYVVCDGTGIPMVPAELVGRKGKQEDGTARTREVKLGCVFTQTSIDEEGRPIRDPGSTSFVGAIEPAEAFGKRLYAEAVRRGLHQARKVSFLGDGAEWIWNLADEQFPMAIKTIDLYHAKEHVSDLCKLLFTSDLHKVEIFRKRWWASLEQGDIDRIAEQAVKSLNPSSPNLKAVETQLAYLERNRHRMRYADFRAQGLFVGSGVVEAGCKTVIALRLKRSGMEWSLWGANSIIALRCSFASDRFDDYWEYRAASLLALSP